MRIPVIVLGGFLGSGKTTLLLSLLKESQERGLRPGVLMNELGKQDVDGYILEEQTGANVEKLLDGCVCCSRKEELGDSLRLLIERRPDVIFIELTGVADPDEIARTLREPYWESRLEAHGWVTLVDAEHVLEYNSRLSADKALVRTLRSQLAAAKLVIVNKSDLVETEVLWKIEKLIRKRNPLAEIEFTVYSRIELRPLLEGIVPLEAKTPSKLAQQSFMASPLREAAIGGEVGTAGEALDERSGATGDAPGTATVNADGAGHTLANSADGWNTVTVKPVHERNDAVGGVARGTKGAAVTDADGRSHTRVKPAAGWNRVPVNPAHRQSGAPGGGHTASYSQVGAVTLAFPQDKTLPKAALEDFFREWSDRLLRAKGHIRLPGEKAAQLVQHAGSRTTWEDSGYPGAPYLVVIGMNLNGEQLAERWSALFR